MDVPKIRVVPVWVVELPLELPDRWFELCRCDSPVGVGEVTRVVSAYRRAPGDQIRVRVEVTEVADVQ